MSDTAEVQEPAIRIIVDAVGQVEKIPLPFRIPVKTWKGALPVRQTLPDYVVFLGIIA